MNSIHNLFPTPVVQIDLNYDFTEDQLLFIKKQPVRPNYGNSTSKNNYILNEPELWELKQLLLSSAQDFIDELYKPKYDIETYITQSWFNYNSSTDFHHKHSHPNSLISGVYYVENTSTDSGKIYFYSDRYRQVYTQPKEHNIYNSVDWWISATPGQLLLFPSYLTHSVEPVAYHETRISLSFNTFAHGLFGEDYALTGLRL